MLKKNISTYDFDDCYRFTVESNILYTVHRYKYRINSLAQQIEMAFYNGYILFAKCFHFILIFIVIIELIDEIFYNSKLKFGVSGKRIPHNLSYYRNIPFDKDIFRAYYIGYEYKLLKNKTDILGAIILNMSRASNHPSGDSGSFGGGSSSGGSGSFGCGGGGGGFR